MENFVIYENVPTVHPPVVERAIGHLAASLTRFATTVGHNAILAYARPFDDMYGTNYHAELAERFNA